MISIYLKINLLLAMAWAVHYFLPKNRLSFRGRKILAQILLAGGLILVPIVEMVPRFEVPLPKFNVLSASDLDGGLMPVGSTQINQLSPREVGALEPARRPEKTNFLLIAFGLGFVFLMARRIRDAIGLSRLIADSLVLHRMGRVTVGLSESVSVPFSAGFFRAYVILPARLALHRADFGVALRHEMEHLRRGDTVWAIALEWLVCAFYLNPVIYGWRKTISHLQELACDEALISRMGISKRDYASCLLRVAEMALDRRFMRAGTTGMIPEGGKNGHSFLRRRIEMFVNHNRVKSGRIAAYTLGTFCCLVLMLLTFVARAALFGDSSKNAGQPVFDSRIQPLAEAALKKGLALHGASAGFAIVGDPLRGTVLAAVSLNNGFDLNMKGDWALSYPLQPGSALKPLIVASALQRKVTKIDDMHDCENGQYQLGRNIYHDVEPYKKLSTADTVVQSSNICTIKISQKLGAKGLAESLHDFGLGKDGAIKDFPGAAEGFLPAAGKLSDEAYIGLISHGIAERSDFFVTPLELVEAYGAIINGGRLMKAIGADGSRTPEMVRDVLSPEVSAQMRKTLEKVVTEGTARSIKGASVRLAGKTSTVVVEGNRRITGFIGYAPADKPKLVIYVAVFDPKGPGKFGSSTAAPIFREIAEKTVGVYRPD